MLKRVCILTLLLLMSLEAVSQKTIFWNDLAKVKFTEKYNEKTGFNYMYPEFDESVKELEGKKVMITGYFLNLDPKSGKYLLSKNPMASCFFCGNGGPETILEIRFLEDQVFEMDEIVTVTGILRLNKDDIEHCNYIIEKADGLTID